MSNSHIESKLGAGYDTHRQSPQELDERAFVDQCAKQAQIDTERFMASVEGGRELDRLAKENGDG